MSAAELESVRVGVVGVGHVGTAHAREISTGRVRGATLAALCDTNPAALAAFPGLPGFSTAERLIASGAIDALLIATPHYDHTPLAVAALAAGLHVLVEKPLAVHKADCLAMLAAYERRPDPRQVFAEMLSQRVDPRFLELRELISSGKLGALRRINWVVTDWFRTDAYYRSSSWRATWRGEGGGVLLNQAPHNLDAWQWLFGMPARVRAFCGFGRFHPIEVEDQVTAYLEYEDGLNGVFVTSTGEAPGSNRLEVAGDLGQVVMEGGTLRITRNAGSTAEFIRHSSDRNARPLVTTESASFQPVDNPRRVVIQNFIAAILKGENLIAPASEGMASVELANAMIYSSIAGQTVDLPLDPALYATELARLVTLNR